MTLDKLIEVLQDHFVVREYREMALAWKLDRDGARKEEQDKKLAQIPVGVTVSVHNNQGDF